jgi:iron complex transport system substrate-binding protein
MFCLIILSCGRNRKTSVSTETGKGNIVSVAKRLAIVNGDGYKQVKILNPWQGAENVSITWYLVNRGEPVPAGIDPSGVIFVPVRKIVCMSTTHLAMITALHEENSIAGMSGIQYIYSPELRKMAEAGKIKDVGYESNLNKELIVDLKPDLVMIYGVGNESSGYVGKLQELGMKVIYNADYLETDPLGKAEWIKLFGALYSCDAMADSVFNAESEAYNTIKSILSEKNPARPKVMLGLPFKDTWFISPGNSFISTLIRDAGGDYLWSDVRSAVSMPLGLENVWMKAMNAEFWLNIGTITSGDEIKAVDARLSDIPCFKKGNLYNNNRRVAPEGGNDFWESGTVYPHLILHDIAAILHPDIFPGGMLYYYRKVN